MKLLKATALGSAMFIIIAPVMVPLMLAGTFAGCVDFFYAGGQ